MWLVLLFVYELPLAVLMYVSIPIMFVRWVFTVMVREPSYQRTPIGAGLCEDCVSMVSTLICLVMNLFLFYYGGSIRPTTMCVCCSPCLCAQSRLRAYLHPW